MAPIINPSSKSWRMRNGASPRSATLAAMVYLAGARRAAVTARRLRFRERGEHVEDAYRSDHGGVGWRTSEAAHLVGATTT